MRTREGLRLAFSVDEVEELVSTTTLEAALAPVTIVGRIEGLVRTRESWLIRGKATTGVIFATVSGPALLRRI